MENVTVFQEFTEQDKTCEALGWLPSRISREFSYRFFSEQECNAWFLSRCYPQGPECPRCGAAVEGEQTLARWWALLRYTCPACGLRSKATHGTLLQDSHLSPRQLLSLLALLGLGVPAAEVARIAGISVHTLARWRERVVALAKVKP